MTTFVHSALYCPKPHSSVRSPLYWPIPHRTTYAHSALYCPIPHFCTFYLTLAYTAHFITFYITLCLHVARDNLFTLSVILTYIHFCVACVAQNRRYVAVPSTRPASLSQHHIPTPIILILATMLLSVFCSVDICKAFCSHMVPST
jgi:hypothetical protein